MLWIAPSEKDDATATLEARLWDAAAQFRANSGLKAQEHSVPVLGLIFLRFAAQHARLKSPSPDRAAHGETLTRPTGEGQVGEGASLGRETKGEVLLVSRLRAALERLKPALPPVAITGAKLFQVFTRSLL